MAPCLFLCQFDFLFEIQCLTKHIHHSSQRPLPNFQFATNFKTLRRQAREGRQRTANILIFNNLENWYNLSTAFCPLPEHMVCGDIVRERPTFWNDFHLSILKWRPAYSDCVMRIAALWHFIYLTSDESKWFGIT